MSQRSRQPRRTTSLTTVFVLLLVGCTSSPEVVGTYEITAHTWIAEIEVTPGKLDCASAGHAVDDGAAYFALVTDPEHGDAVQYLRCEDPASCAAPRSDYAWFAVDGSAGVNALATVITNEFTPPYCDLSLETFDVSNPGASSIHIDLLGRRGAADDIAGCTIDRARSLAAEPTCIWVDRLDGRRVR
jgi:hypothetical protein